MAEDVERMSDEEAEAFADAAYHDDCGSWPPPDLPPLIGTPEEVYVATLMERGLLPEDSHLDDWLPLEP